MNQEWDPSAFRARVVKFNYNSLKQMKSMGLAFFKPGYEPYFLHYAYTVLISFMNSDCFEECAIIRDLIDEFMEKQPQSFHLDWEETLDRFNQRNDRSPNFRNNRKK